MKKILLTATLIMAFLSVKSQESTNTTSNPHTFMRGDMLLSMDVQVVKIIKQKGELESWEGMPIRAGFEYLFYNKERVFLSSGLNATYLRHQPGDGDNYGVLGIAVPINIHLAFVPRLDTYIGYKIGHYIDGYEPANELAPDGYGGLYSDAYIGVRYFLTPHFAVYSELSADALRLYGGISYRF